MFLLAYIGMLIHSYTARVMCFEENPMFFFFTKAKEISSTKHDPQERQAEFGQWSGTEHLHE